MKRLTRVRVSPSGQSRARLPFSRVPIRSDKIQRQPNNDEPKPADAGYSSCAQPVTGPAFPARAAMLFRLLSGSAAPRPGRCRRSSPETTGRRRLPAGKPAASPSLPPLRRAGSRAPSAPALGGRQLTRHSRLRKEREDDEGEPRGRPCSPRGRSARRASRARPRRGTAGARRRERPSPRPRR